MRAAAEKPRPATLADLEGVSPNLVAEIIDGALVTSPRPGSPHARASAVLGIDLGGPFYRGRGGPGGWVILDEPELHCGPDVLVPDLAGWRRTRMPKVPDVAAFTLAPDWVCEVLSPSTAGVDRADKMPIYAREGVGHTWLVDPAVQTLEVFALDAGSWRLVTVFHGECAVRAVPFDAVELDLAALWAR